MDHVNQGFIAHLVAGPDDPVHLLLHLGIAALHRVKIQFLGIFALEHGGGRTAAETDPVGRATYLDNDHPLFFRILFRMPIIDLADAAGEHDGF